MSTSGMIEQERYTCAIGALQSVVAIPRAVPILHSGPGCGTMILGFFERGTGYAGGYTSPCTNFSETEVVFGGVDKLRQLIVNTDKVLDSDLQVVLTGCTADIVGDDVGSVLSEFVDAGRPLVHVETAGFKSNNLVAHSNVVNAIIDQYVDLFAAVHPSRSDALLVNVFASLPYQDPFWKGNLREYKRLFEALGLKVNILFGPESAGVDEWKSIPEANFNVLISPWYGLPIVEHLQERYDQPYFRFPYVPIGANETTRLLEGLSAFAIEQGAPLNPRRTRALIEHEEQAFYEEIDNLATFLLEFRYGLPNHVHILHDAGYVVGLSRFLLHEVGIVPKEQFIVDGTPEEYQAAVRADLAATSDRREIPVSFDVDAGAAQRALRELYGVAAGAGAAGAAASEGDATAAGGGGGAAAAAAGGGAAGGGAAAAGGGAATGDAAIGGGDPTAAAIAVGAHGGGQGGTAGHEGRGLIIGSGWDKELARDLSCDFLPAAVPDPYRLVLTTNYAGYTGGLRVIEDIYDVVLSTYA
ncbi:MAG: hypothetical protein LBO07_07535 [Coriobacteriales bacterium]|jgi:nitrogenase molybdenum-iron protein beta chain|nr:hypothetical protein [Coriobacteriales bacterium]